MIDTANTARRMLRVPEAATFLGVSVAYLNNLRSKGGGPVYVRMGRAVGYRLYDLEKWVADRSRASVSDKGGAPDIGVIQQAFIASLRHRLLAGPWILRRRLDDDRRSYLRDALAAWSKAHDEMCCCDIADFDQVAASRQIAKGNDLAQRAGFGEDDLRRAYEFSMVNDHRQRPAFEEELAGLEDISAADLAAGYVV